MRRATLTTTLVALSLLGFQSLAQAGLLPSLPLDEQWQTVQNDSYEMVKARNDLQLAADDLDILWWDDTDIILSSSTQHDLDADDTRTELELDVSIPLNSNLDIGTTLARDVGSTSDDSEDIRTKLYATYKPFALSDVTPKMVEDYELSKLGLESTRRDLKIELEEAYLNLIVTQQRYAIAELELKISEQAQTSIRGAFDLGESSATELLDAQNDTIDAREDLYSSMIAVAEAEQAYQELLGDKVNTDVSDDIEYRALSTLVEQRHEVIATLDNKDAQSETLRTMAVELTSLKQQLDDIYDYDPDLTLSTTYDVDEESITGMISLNLSPDQFGAEDQAEAAMDVRLKQMEIADEDRSLLVLLKVTRKKVEIATAALESNIRALEQEQINVKEAEYLYEVGERTNVELAQQQLALSLSEVTAFVALVELYQAQSNLATLFE